MVVGVGKCFLFREVSSVQRYRPCQRCSTVRYPGSEDNNIHIILLTVPYYIPGSLQRLGRITHWSHRGRVGPP